MEFKKNVPLAALRTVRLWFNHWQGKPLTTTDSAHPVVCMTSHGKRIATAWQSIESIGSGRVRPSRLVLWLDEREMKNPLPKKIIQQMSRGLEVRYGPDGLGPHAKYYNHVEQSGAFNSDLVTADDDILYPRSWLEGLRNAANMHKAEIVCYRAHRIELSGGRILPYKQWTRCKSDQPSQLHFATGVSGVLYPPSMQSALKQSGKQFLECSPRADDIWLHVVALRSGHKVRQIHKKRLHFPAILGDKEAPLHAQNIHLHANDKQVQDTYTKADIDVLQAQAGRGHRA